MTQKNMDISYIRELAKVLEETGLTEIEIEENDTRVRVVKTPPVVHSVAAVSSAPVVAAPSAASPSDVKVQKPGDHPGTVKSPMVGVIYVAPKPGSPPFVKVGDKVQAGDTLVIVEAMKVMNPVTAPRSGTVTEIFAQDATPVEFDEPLLVIE